MDENDFVFVNIGVPFSNIPIMQKVMIYQKAFLTPILAAKWLRSQVAKNLDVYGWHCEINFKEEELYYEIYGSPENTVPFAMSFNSPYRKVHVDGRTTS